jgi:hypothetical protein
MLRPPIPAISCNPLYSFPRHHRRGSMTSVRNTWNFMFSRVDFSRMSRSFSTQNALPNPDQQVQKVKNPRIVLKDPGDLLCFPGHRITGRGGEKVHWGVECPAHIASSLQHKTGWLSTPESRRPLWFLPQSRSPGRGSWPHKCRIQCRCGDRYDTGYHPR